MAGAVAVAVATAGPAGAQERPPGPFTFRLDLRAEATENRTLAAVNPGTSTFGEARLGFGFRRETGVEALTIDARAVLRAVGGAAALPSGLQDPRIVLVYTRAGARGSLRLSAGFRQNEIAGLRDLADFLDPETGALVLPPDFEALTGTGTRQVADAAARLTLGADTPLALTLTAGLSDTRHDNAAPALVDALRANAGASLRFGLSPVLSLTTGVRAARFVPAVGAVREAAGFDLALAQDFPRGTAALALAADILREGTQLGLSASRTLELPAGALALQLGVVQPAGGAALALTGAIRYRQDLAIGSLTAEASRSVVPGADDTPRTLTTLRLAYGQDLVPGGRLALNAVHSISAVVATGTETATTTLSASYSHPLTRDWALTVGANHRIRRDAALAQSTGVFVSIGRLWP